MENQETKKKGGFGKIALYVIGGFIAIMALASIISHTSNGGQGYKSPYEYLVITNDGWTLGGYGNVAIHKFTIKNTSTKDIKDADVYIQYTSKSGTALGTTEKVIYEVIPAGKSVSFTKVNMGFVDSQVESAYVSIVHARYAE